MKFKKIHLYVIAAFLITSNTSSALILGNAEVKSNLGEKLNIKIPVTFDSQEEFECNFRNKELERNGFDTIDDGSAQNLSYKLSGTGFNRILNISSKDYYNNPIASFYVAADCGSYFNLVRRYTALIDYAEISDSQVAENDQVKLESNNFQKTQYVKNKKSKVHKKKKEKFNPSLLISKPTEDLPTIKILPSVNDFIKIPNKLIDEYNELVDRNEKSKNDIDLINLKIKDQEKKVAELRQALKDFVPVNGLIVEPSSEANENKSVVNTDIAVSENVNPVQIEAPVSQNVDSNDISESAQNENFLSDTIKYSVTGLAVLMLSGILYFVTKRRKKMVMEVTETLMEAKTIFIEDDKTKTNNTLTEKSDATDNLGLFNFVDEVGFDVEDVGHHDFDESDFRSSSSATKTMPEKTINPVTKQKLDVATIPMVEEFQGSPVEEIEIKLKNLEEDDKPLEDINSLIFTDTRQQSTDIPLSNADLPLVEDLSVSDLIIKDNNKHLAFEKEFSETKAKTSENEVINIDLATLEDIEINTSAALPSIDFTFEATEPVKDDTEIDKSIANIKKTLGLPVLETNQNAILLDENVFNVIDESQKEEDVSTQNLVELDFDVSEYKSATA